MCLWQMHASESCACVFVCFCGKSRVCCICMSCMVAASRDGRGMRVSYVLVCLFVFAGTIWHFFVGHELPGGCDQRCAFGRGMRVSHVLVCLYVFAGTIWHCIVGHELHGCGIQRCACGRGMRVSHVLVCLYVIAGTVEFFVYP